MTEAPADADCDVAIVGMAGRFPGASGLESFWENLRDGVTSISFFSDAELAQAGVDAVTLRDPSYVKAAPILDDVDRFDSAFFGYSPREAAFIDPQQRLLLECAWEAVEDAGCSASGYRYPVGVYVGSSLNTYFLATGLMHQLAKEFVLTLSSSDKDFLATRIAYKLNLEGPAITVQSACSTSLVAVHVACQALLSGECDMALAGGVCVKVPQRAGYFWQQGGIVSRDGRVRAFGAGATGTVFGSGAGIVVLKRLQDALRSRDSIRAVIRGTAVNNDGSSKASYTAPSVDKQAEVIVEALAKSGVAPGMVSYVEAHGTGTLLGDPIEVTALTKAFRTGTDEKGFCAIGSVKPNVGHLEAASGVVGLIKTVLALEHEAIPPLAEWGEPNPACEFSTSPFFVNAQLRAWPRGEVPRRAGVSSLGVGGTNAHVVLEEAPLPGPSGPSRAVQILPVSARTGPALSEALQRLAAHLKRSAADVPLADVAFTLQTGRRELLHRSFVVSDSPGDAARQISAMSYPIDGMTRARRRDPVFVLPADAAVCDWQAEELCREPEFRRDFERCSGLRPNAGAAIEHWAAQSLSTFAVEYALAQQWIRWGVRPKKVIAEGTGELVAACLAGASSLDEALLRATDRPLPVQPGRLAEDISDLAGREDLAIVVLGAAGELAEPCKLWRAESVTGPAFVESCQNPGTRGRQLERLLLALGTLWASGVAVGWSSLHASKLRRRVPLPTYPFQRERHWWEGT